MTDEESSSRRCERAFVAALAAAAALRVLVLAAAFPFFTNVDEHRHVDMVLKYARGYLPRPGSDAYEPRTAALLGLHGSPEYALSASDERPVPPPVWARAPGETVRRLRANERFIARGPNLEAFQPPVYYALAGGWLRLGSALGLDAGAALYWIRGLNGLFIAGVVLTAWALLRQTHPRDALVRLGVPALLAAAPMDVFHYATPDALSPLVAGLGLALAVRVAAVPERSIAAFAAAGGVAAVAFLTKYTNATLVGVLGLGTLWLLWPAPRRVPAYAPESDSGSGSGAPRWAGLAALWLCLLAPAGLWLLRNTLLFGDPTATSTKIDFLGWQEKPFAAWWDHPLFTPAGAVSFVRDLVPMFWRGEVVWRREVLASPAADAFYTWSSLAALPLAALALRRSFGAARLAEAASLAMLLFSVALLAGLSLAFEFHATSNPPAHHPYFVQGRLVSGALLAAAIVYVRAIGLATSPLPSRLRPFAGAFAVVCAIFVCLTSELALSRPVFSSAYNFYHLP
jgi:hypothetical protein